MPLVPLPTPGAIHLVRNGHELPDLGASGEGAQSAQNATRKRIGGCCSLRARYINDDQKRVRNYEVESHVGAAFRRD